MKTFEVKFLLVASLAGLSARAGEVSVKPISAKAAASQEQLDRTVDRVALQSQQAAIGRLKELAARYTGSAQEPQLLARLAEAYQQDAAIRFRVAHGRAHRAGAAPDLSGFNKSMKSSIDILDRLVKSFPQNPDLHEAYFLRAKAYDEMQAKAAAKADYNYLVVKFPQSSYASVSHMRLAEYAIDENEYNVAVAQLEAVEKRPDDAQYPFALYKLAWSHYNLNHVGRALGYLERHVEFYRKAIEKMPVASATSESALIENSLMDFVLFHYEGYEKHHAGFEPSIAWDEFHRIEKGELLGRMLSRYARLLRAGGFEEPMLAWKERSLKEEIGRPESLDVVMTVFEHRVTRHEYSQLPVLANDLVHIYDTSTKLRDSTAFDNARKTLLTTTEELQGLVLKNKNATEVTKLALALQDLYLAFEKVVSPDDARIPKARFNLAEAFYQIGNYDKATEHYRWIVERWKPYAKSEAEWSEGARRAVAARYQALRREGKIPDRLDAKSRFTTQARSEPRVREWVTWIDQLPRENQQAEKVTSQETLNFNFEANRALYAMGEVKESVARFEKFVSNHPESEFAPASASLVIDTLLVEADWDRVLELSRDWSSQDAWKNSDFAKRLAGLERDMAYKIAERAFDKKDFDAARSAAKSCAKRYKGEPREADCRLLEARALLALNEADDAEERLTELVKNVPTSSAAEAGLVQRARLLEARYDYVGAAKDYAELGGRDGTEGRVRERALWLAWMAGDMAYLTDLLGREKFCGAGVSSSSQDLCARLTALLWLSEPARAARLSNKPTDDMLSPDAVKNSREKALFALAALKWNTKLSSSDREELLGLLADQWKNVDSLAQFQALPLLADTVRSSLDAVRVDIASDNILKAEKKAIKKRLGRIEAFEAVAARLVKLPWTRVRAEVLDVTASAYADLGASLRNVPAPKDFPANELEAYHQTLAELALPFEEKAQDIREKSIQLVLKAGVERETFDRVAKAFYAENPSQAKKLAASDANHAKLRVPLVAELSAFDPKGGWQKSLATRAPAANSPETKAEFLRWSWRKAFEEHRRSAAAHWLNELTNAKLVSEKTQSWMKALLLLDAGARAEGLALIENLHPETEGTAALTTAKVDSSAKGVVR